MCFASFFQTSTDIRDEIPGHPPPASQTGYTSQTGNTAYSAQRAIHLSSTKGAVETSGVSQDNLPPDHMELLRRYMYAHTTHQPVVCSTPVGRVSPCTCVRLKLTSLPYPHVL